MPLALVLAVSACGAGGPADQSAATKPPAAVTVVTLQARSSTLQRELAGRTVASRVAEVRPQVTGLIERRLFTEGSQVRAGEPLYTIDDSAYRSAQNSARAALARAEATLETARLNARRTRELVAIDAISRQDAENAQAALQQAQADVLAAQAAVEGAEVTLGFTRLTAPISGQIGRSAVTQGALVTAAQTTPLATIQQLDPIYVDVTQSSAELLALRRELAAGGLRGVGDVPVQLVLEDGSTYAHEGRLAFSEVTVDPTTGSYTLRVVAPNPDGLLMPGMYVRALITRGIRPDALLVPQQAVARDPKGNTSVMVVGPDNKVLVRPIRVSRTVGDAWLVESGLAPGERVVVEGLQKIAPGAVVAATEAAAEPAAAAGGAAGNR